MSDREAMQKEEPWRSLYASEAEQHRALTNAGYVNITTRQTFDNLYLISSQRQVHSEDK